MLSIVLLTSLSDMLIVKNISVSFDGEALTIVVCSASEEWTLEHSYENVGKSMNGEELAR